MPFVPGRPKSGGREFGTPNRLTAVFGRQSYGCMTGLEDMQLFFNGHGKTRPSITELAIHLIPVEMRDDNGSKTVEVIVQR